MQRLIVSTSALVLGFALASAAAEAQNVQGPGAPNFGLTSNPQNGGIINTAPNANTATGQRPLYNYAPGDQGAQARPTSKHATGGYRR
jgi:hypothetical protein